MRCMQANQVKAEVPVLEVQKEPPRVTMDNRARLPAQPRQNLRPSTDKGEGIPNPNLNSKVTPIGPRAKSSKVLRSQNPLLGSGLLKESDTDIVCF